MLYMKCEKSSIQRFDTCPPRCTTRRKGYSVMNNLFSFQTFYAHVCRNGSALNKWIIPV